MGFGVKGLMLRIRSPRPLPARAVNYSLEISGNPCEKSKISNSFDRNAEIHLKSETSRTLNIQVIFPSSPPPAKYKMIQRSKFSEPFRI